MKRCFLSGSWKNAPMGEAFTPQVPPKGRSGGNREEFYLLLMENRLRLDHLTAELRQTGHPSS